MDKMPFWQQILEQIFPRLLALIAFSYLIYSLTWQVDEFGNMHIWILVLALAMIALPAASRLKIFNLLDFSAKFNSFKKETQKEISEIKNTITTLITTKQHQQTIINVGEKEAKVWKDSIAEDFVSDKLGGETDWSRSKFLKLGERHAAWAYDSLFIARAVQIAINENRIITPDEYPDGDMYDNTMTMLDQ